MRGEQMYKTENKYISDVLTEDNVLSWTNQQQK